ncbi:MAG: hypothetical protein GWO20_19865 [Candidatus Korarchaeota archaeon]|nr:hypothetical protein [Candidatus Korarchaeota archaeon]NIU85491.1 hypothetical protein [Candidatus Thorarchaeota archaeon]NIW15608.1 hypothetical protein [Candidatus Thorarchaeota archaeon]NIW53539.1 hypothetical protein [Candidatus Korarchaeota archaeon]
MGRDAFVLEEGVEIEIAENLYICGDLTIQWRKETIAGELQLFLHMLAKSFL